MRTKRLSLDLVVVVALFCLYTGSALILCAIGVQVYRGTADTMRQNYDERTSILYISEKVRHYDTEGSVRIDKVKGNDALVLVEKRNDRVFETWLFIQDGILYEGFFIQGTVPDIRLCQAILPMKSMEIQRQLAPGVSGVSGSKSDGQLISIVFTTTDGQTKSIDLWLRSSGKPGA